MLLKNYFNYESLLFENKRVPMVDMSGHSATMSSLLYNSKKCVVGSGMTPAKVDDYALESEIHGINTTFNVNVSDSGTKIVNIISNLSNETVTISEIGIACGIDTSTLYLMTRTVLEEPLVLEVGDIVAIETQFA